MFICLFIRNDFNFSSHFGTNYAYVINGYEHIWGYSWFLTTKQGM